MNSTAPTREQLRRDNSRAMSVRMSNEHFHHLIAQAHLREVSMAEVVRQALDRDIAAMPDLGHEDGEPGVSMRYRDLLQVGDFTAALEELQAADAE